MNAMPATIQQVPEDSFERLTPVFMLGIARSGTTLLQSLLDGHPQLLVDVADSHFFRWYRQYYRWPNALTSWTHNRQRRIETAERYMITHIFNELSRYYQDFLSHISIPEIRALFRDMISQSPGRPQDYLASRFYALGLASGGLTPRTLYWVDKTLSYEYLFYRYAQWWPRARFMFVIRDPRDVYASYKSRDLKNGRSVTLIDSFAYTWSQSIRVLMDSQRLLPPEQVFTLKYEELTADAEAVMTRLAQFLGIEKTPGLLQPTKGFGRVPWGGNAESERKEYGVFQDAANKWKKKLDPLEANQIEGLLHRQMAHVGYELSAPLRVDQLLKIKYNARKVMFAFLNLGM